MKPFWRWLETRSDRTAVMVEWQQVATDCVDAVLPFLQPLDVMATSYPNPRRHGQPMKIIRHAQDDVVAIDPDDYRHRLRLTSADAVLYQLNLRDVRSMLCKVLDGVNIAKTPVDQNARFLQIGNWEPQQSASFPVYLMLCQHPRILRDELLQLQAHCDRPGAILLTPSRMNWNSQIDALARSKKMLFVPLSEVIEPEDNAFYETPAWEKYMQGFAQMVQITLPSNYRKKKPLAKRAELMAKAEKVKVALLEHIRSSRDGVVANLDAGKGATLVKFLTKTELANLAGLEPHNITRCFRADPQLKILYEIANDPEEILRYGK